MSRPQRPVGKIGEAIIGPPAIRPIRPFLRTGSPNIRTGRAGRAYAATAALLLGCICAAPEAQAQVAPACASMRKISVGVSVSPPNVVHTTPYVARDLGLFAKRCIEVNIIQFDGGESPAATAAVSQGSATANVSDVVIGRGMKAKQIWGLAPRPPQAYAVSEPVKTAADLKGRRLSAAGGG